MLNLLSRRNISIDNHYHNLPVYDPLICRFYFFNFYYHNSIKFNIHIYKLKLHIAFELGHPEYRHRIHHPKLNDTKYQIALISYRKYRKP